jgi:GNAT superfamily N-acetyltransferase
MSNKVKYAMRVATSEDALSIAYVHHNSRQLAYRSILGEELLNAQSLADREKFWKEQTTRERLDDAEILVAENANTPGIIGFIVWFKLSEKTDISDKTDTSLPVAEIDRIYVHPEFIGKGVGSALMKHCLGRLNTLGYKRAILWVFEANARARSFYEAMGFSTDGNRRKIEPYPHDLIYTRDL